MVKAKFSRRRIAWLALAVASAALLALPAVRMQAGNNEPAQRKTGVNVEGNKATLKQGFRFVPKAGGTVEVEKVADGTSNTVVATVKCASCDKKQCDLVVSNNNVYCDHPACASDCPIRVTVAQ